ncbi:MAG: hypothetical protein BGO29_15535 [Bacteroidales bacterium 36-12]|nr:MAG: hypothetical protein BGO29_15535 [Bacteroidales bacterium 36-12]
MAKIKSLVSFITDWEGGFVDDPDDSGGPTNRGVTLKIWKQVGYDKNNDGLIDENDVFLITHEEMIEVVLKPNYWDCWKADQIKNQSIANLVVDWMWLSGGRTINIVQEILGIKQDGIVGKETLNALNNYPDQQLLFNLIKMKRINDIHDICSRNSQNNKFRNGWINRTAAHKFISLLLFFVVLTGFYSCSSIKRVDFNRNNEQLENIQELIKVQEQQSNALSDIEIISVESDSITETYVLNYSRPQTSNSGKPAASVNEQATAIIQRNKKTETRVRSMKQELYSTQLHDTIHTKVVVEKVVYKESPKAASGNKLLIRVVGFLFLVFGLWLYYVFRIKK